jgi:hypothetical protein
MGSTHDGRRLGLLISDSMMKNVPPQGVIALKKKFSLDELVLKGFSGFTSGRLLHDGGEIWEIIEEIGLSDLKIIFVCCGQNDFSRRVKYESLCNVNPEQVSESVAEDIRINLCHILDRLRNVQVIFLPLTFRKVNLKNNSPHPESLDPKWIDVVNVSINHFNNHFQPCLCHEKRVTKVSNHQFDLLSHLERDGIHLKDTGKILMIQLVLNCGVALKDESHSYVDKNFPELPKKEKNSNPLDLILPNLKIQPRSVTKENNFVSRCRVGASKDNPLICKISLPLNVSSTDAQNCRSQKSRASKTQRKKEKSQHLTPSRANSLFSFPSQIVCDVIDLTVSKKHAANILRYKRGRRRSSLKV